MINLVSLSEKIYPFICLKTQHLIPFVSFFSIPFATLIPYPYNIEKRKNSHEKRA